MRRKTTRLLQKAAMPFHVRSLVCDAADFGYNRVGVCEPLFNLDGSIVVDKKGSPVADAEREDTEDIPLSYDIDEYMEKKVLPFNEHAMAKQKEAKKQVTLSHSPGSSMNLWILKPSMTRLRNFLAR